MVQRHLLSTKKTTSRTLTRVESALMVEASQISALSGLNRNVGFFLQHFHMVILIVQEAYKALADHHLHVDVSVCAFNLARRWMVHDNDRSFRKT